MTTDNNTLRALVDLRDRTLQKSRIAFGLRIGAIERGADKADDATVELLSRWQERFQELEDEADKDITALVSDLPIVDAMIQVRGVGKLLAAKVVSMVDIHEAETVSDLWRFSGYAVIDGEREKPVKGEKLHYNKRLKTTCYLVASSFLRSNSPYREVYDSSREYYEANRKDWTKAHIHNAAMRRMLKLWLSHFWQVYRQLEGLPTREPYAMQIGHNHYRPPQDFGWPEIASLIE